MDREELFGKLNVTTYIVFYLSCEQLHSSTFEAGILCSSSGNGGQEKDTILDI